MPKLLHVSLALFCIMLLGSDAYSVEKIRKPILETHREKFDIQLKLYNGETLSKLIPSVEGNITSNRELLKATKCLYISALYKGVGTAFLRINIKSPNNRQLGIPDYHLQLTGGVRLHQVFWLGGTLMETSDEDAILEYEITDVWYK